MGRGGEALRGSSRALLKYRPPLHVSDMLALVSQCFNMRILIMMGRRRLVQFAAVALLAWSAGRPAVALDTFWEGDVDANYANPNNWGDGIVPENNAGFGYYLRAIIGSTQRVPTATGNPTAQTVTDGVANLSAPVPTAGGLVLGLDGGSTGTLNISPGANLTHTTTPDANIGSDGRVFVGGGGRGYLNMTGGTLTGTALIVGGEQLTTGNGASRADFSGTSTVTISGPATFGRRLRVTGPNVNFSATGTIALQSGNNYTAGITSATAHSPLKTTGNVSIGGSFNVEYSGAAPAMGQTWNLFDYGGGLSGNFNNLLTGGDVPITGAPATVPGEAYRLRQTTGGVNGKLLQLVHDRVLVLRVNRDTGELSIRNPLSGAISIDGYTVNSGRGSLLTTYKGISGAPAGDVNWSKYGLSANNLTEVKNDPASATSTLNLTSVPSLTLGTGFSKTAVGASTANFGLSGEDIVFDYTSPLGGVVRGHVEYVGTRFENNLVLRVNPTTGHAFLKNDSSISIKIDAYSILSSTGSLNGGSWTGIGGSWEKSSPPTTGALSESNPVGSTTLAPNAQIDIGTIGTFTTTPAQAGLSMQFLLAEGFTATSPPGDFDLSGRVDGADFLVWQRGLGTTRTAAELATWRTNFGSVGVAAPETNFRAASIVFDATAGVPAVAQVPEPASAILLLAGIALVAVPRTRRGNHTHSFTQARVARERGAASLSGVATMRSVMRGRAVIAAFAILLSAVPAFAVTQGIPLTNRRFELPGPTGTKVLAFDTSGVPIAGVIPGWVFEGPGAETFGDNVPGDSGTEGGGNPGNELLLSTLDGIVYQSTAVNVIAATPATQAYRLSFDAHDIFTIDASNNGFPTSQAQLTARMYYVALDGITRNTIGTPLVVSALPGAWTNYSLVVPGGPALAAANGRPIGVEFDTTSIEFNPLVAHSWVGVDNVLLQISGVSTGDLNGDGTVNLTDYRIIRDNLQETHEYFANGDMNDDGAVNLLDFRVWKSLPAVVASGVLAQIAVPEPATYTAGLITLVAIAGMARGRKAASLKRPRQSAIVVAALVALTLAGARRSSAELLLYEPFNIPPYTAGQLAGQDPSVGPGSPTFFSGPWVQTSPALPAVGEIVQAGSLSYLGAPSVGGSVTATGDSRVGRNLTTPWDASTEGTFYISFLANYGTVANPATTTPADLGFRTTEFWPVGGAIGNDSGRSEIGFQGFGGVPNLPSTATLRFAGPGGVFPLTDTVFNDFGGTHLIVMKFVLSATPASDTVSVFLNPLTASEPEVPQANAANIDFTLTAMSTISKFGGTGVKPVFDELRVATTYAEAIPALPFPGDTNGDGLVNMVDYNNIVSHMNQSVASALDGDVALANGKQGSDGRVTLGDYRLWRDNRTDVPHGTVTNLPVPEPSSLALAFAAATAGLIRRKHRGRA
jgi:hypothetical protein